MASDEFVIKRLMVPKNNERGPAAAELFFAALHGTFTKMLKVQSIMSFEIVSINQFIQFYFRVPKYLVGFVEGQLYAQYPTLEVLQADDYTENILEEKYAVGLDLITERDDVFPIKTFQSFEADPISGITSVLSQLDPSEEVWIQICVSPTDNKWQKKAVGYVNAIRAGRDPNEPLWKSLAKGLFGAARDLSKSADQTSANQAADVSGPMQMALKGVEEKTTKLGFATKIRVAALSPDYEKAKRRLTEAVAAFKQFNVANMNGFLPGGTVEGLAALELYRSRTLGF